MSNKIEKNMFIRMTTDALEKCNDLTQAFIKGMSEMYPEATNFSLSFHPSTYYGGKPRIDLQINMEHTRIIPRSKSATTVTKKATNKKTTKKMVAKSKSATQQQQRKRA